MGASLGHEPMCPVDVGACLDRIDRGDGTAVFRHQQPCPRAHALQVTAEMCLQFTNAHSLHVCLAESDHKCNMMWSQSYRVECVATEHPVVHAANVGRIE